LPVQPVARIITVGVVLFIRFLLALRNVENLLFKRGINTSHQKMRQ